MDVAVLAEAVSNAVGPFLPYLITAGKEAGKKLEEVVTDQASQGLWNTAKALWGRVTERFGDDREVEDAAGLVAAAPGNALRAQVLVEVLAQRLHADPQLAAELQALLGGPERVQRVAAGDDAQLARVRQEMAGAGTQEVTAGNRARMSNVVQVMK
jgi:hypothetical protein